MTKYLVTILFLILGCCSLSADEPLEFQATVLSVQDGDTMRVRRSTDQKFFKLRLFGIDAPELSQTAGVTSKNALQTLVGDGEVTVKTTGEVTYGRHVARVYAEENCLNEAQVMDGWAWHYDNYTEGEPEHQDFKELQEQAQGDGSGLWAFADPIPPWDYRRMIRDGEIIPAPLAIAGSDATPVAGAADFILALDRRTLAPRLAHAARSALSGEHALHGHPLPLDGRHRFTPPGHTEEVDGITVLARGAFTLGHYDKYRVPAWAAMKWTKADFDRSEEVSFTRPSWKKDTDLPVYARGDGKLNYSTTKLQKGHVVRDADLEAWGEEAVEQGTLLSNAMPQREHANHAVWGVLEDEHRNIVQNNEDEYEIDTVWVIAGPIFYQGQDVEWVNVTAIPHATYKIIAWQNADGELRTRGYIIGQDETNTMISEHLRPIDQIEAATGLDFFPSLDDDIEADLEDDQHHALWE